MSAATNSGQFASHVKDHPRLLGALFLILLLMSQGSAAAGGVTACAGP